MQEVYFDRIPTEIMAEILLYLDIEDIKLINIKEIIESKGFWIQKLMHDGMKDYVSLLGFFNYMKDYTNFKYINNDINFNIKNNKYIYFRYYFKNSDDVFEKLLDSQCNDIDIVRFIIPKVEPNIMRPLRSTDYYMNCIELNRTVDIMRIVNCRNNNYEHITLSQFCNIYKIISVSMKIFHEL